MLVFLTEIEVFLPWWILSGMRQVLYRQPKSWGWGDVTWGDHQNAFITIHTSAREEGRIAGGKRLKVCDNGEKGVGKGAKAFVDRRGRQQPTAGGPI